MDHKKHEKHQREHPAVHLPAGVMKIKQGYNPNSSSIGTLVYAFPLAAAALSGIVAVLSAVLAKRDDPPEKEQ